MKDYSESTDEELLREYHTERNPYLLNILFKRHANVGFRTAMRYMRNQPDAEDVLQLAFIHFLQSLHLTREGSTNVKAWLMKVIVNISIDKIREEKRRAKRQEKVASERFSQHNQQMDIAQMTNDKDELKIKIRQTVDTLPEKYRSPIWLILYEGFSYPEAASVLALPEKTVRTQVARGLERLREIFGTVGSALSVDMIASLIVDSKLEMAPNSVKQIIDSPELYKSISGTSKKILVQSAKPVFSALTKLIFFSFVIGAGIFSILYFNNTKQPIIEKPTLVNERFSKLLNFNQPNQENSYSFLGSTQYLENDGLAKSGCIELPNNYVMRIPITKSQLPIKISFRWNVKLTINETQDIASIQMCIPFWGGGWDRIGRFVSLSRSDEIIDGSVTGYIFKTDEKWQHQTIWITENSIDSWIDEKRVSLDIIDQKETSKYFYLLFFKDHKMDDFLIETVDKNQLPDISKFIKTNVEIFTNSTENETDLTNYLPELSNKLLQPKHIRSKAMNEDQFNKAILSLYNNE